ncbi:hypothetical protein GGI25_004252 [Coemansia spiralis]|uniref:Uncharacterized protein n=2 Tax=Coemansia TaxID=4863 RepID=A0A9W8G4S9_9FUNG|nr:transferase family-domain-containing protein [Coemansia spiralis]KAJ1990504.1 hypothetical protein EDC05_004045 [Coemansia umbellata]KAJ2620810.1 hypothetical protein GGI26_004706 [Coemansia sp. RSA 1358]KAJ2674601.1 hypothetical protein GGI25_004252 [Coemansia spiralis]
MANNSVNSDEHRYSITNNISYLYQVYCSYLILFKNEDECASFLSSKLLKQGLNILARKYYQPISGWFDICGDEIDVVYYNSKFNDPPFSTQVLDMNYNTLAQHVDASNIELLAPKSPSPLITPDNSDIPMLLVKASYLNSNEGMVIGVSYHHSLMDGSAFWYFMNNWAHICKLLHVHGPHYSDFSIPYPVSFEFPSIGKLHDPTCSFEHTEYELVDASDCIRQFAPGLETTKEIRLHISVEQQQEIRQSARANDVSFTAMLCAMFWKETNRLRIKAKPAIASEMSLYTCAVNPRPQLGLLSNLCASPVMNMAAKKVVGEIAQLELSEVAQIVHNTIRRCNAEYTYSSTNFLLAQRKKELEAKRNGQNGKEAMLVYILPMALKCTVSSSRTFPIYQLDFGFGKPEYVRPPFLPYDGCMRIWPTPESFSSAECKLVNEAPIEIYITQPDYVDLSESPLLRPFFVRT